MAAKTSSRTPGKKKPAPVQKAKPKKSPPVTSQTGQAKVLSADMLKKTIAYFYLLSYCPPSQLEGFRKGTTPMRKALAESAGMSEAAYFKAVVPEVCRRVVAFHQATREPEKKDIEALEKAALSADKNATTLAAFQSEMKRIAMLPGRAKPENRLHRNRGCRYCAAPCQYGYFTLVSDPQMKELQALFAGETQRPVGEQTPLRPAYGFATSHLASLTGSPAGTVEFTHVVNLAFCLLLLGMAKSRMALPERQLLIFQGASQELLRRLGRAEAPKRKK